MTTEALLRQLEGVAPEASVSSGLSSLDEPTGGVAQGRLWVVTGVAAQGRSTLLTQLAATLAVAHGWSTVLSCPRESARSVAARLVACQTYDVVWDLARGGRTRPTDSGRARRWDALAAAPLRVVAGGGADPFAIDGELEATSSDAVLVDDAHLVAGAFPARLRALADEGAFVAVTLPRHLVVERDAAGPYLLHEWSDAADVVLEVRQATWPAHETLRPGEVDLSLLTNRRGPCLTVPVVHLRHCNRFVDGPA